MIFSGPLGEQISRDRDDLASKLQYYLVRINSSRDLLDAGIVPKSNLITPAASVK